MLYIFTPIFCVALCVGAVFSFLNKDNKVTANAGTKAVDSSIVEFTFDEKRETYYNSTLSGDTAEGFYNTLPEDNTSINISLTPTFTNGGGNITASCEQKAGSKAVFMLYHTTIVVPAGLTYRVDYNYDWVATKTSSTSSEESGWTSSMCLLGENADILDTAKFNMFYDPYITPNVMLRQNNGKPSSGSGTASFSSEQCNQLVYVNTDGSAKTFDTYFLYIAGMRAGTSFSNKFNMNIDISVTVNEECVGIPQNLTATFDAYNHWLDSFSDSWIETNHTDNTVTEVKNISYVPSTGGAAQNLGNDTTKIVDAGEYTVTMGLANGAGKRWSDETTSDKTFKITIGKATPSVNATFPSDRPFTTSGFPDPINYTAACNGNSLTGKFEWINQNQLIEANKSKEYEWTFKPDDGINYISVTGKATFNFQERKIQSKTYTWKPEITTIYTKTSVSDLMDMITLEVMYNDSSTPVNETNFNIESANLVAGFGNSYVMLSFGGAPEKFIIPSTVEVIEAAMESLTVMFNQNGKTVTVETPLDDLKQNLTVWVKWNYNVDQIKIEDKSAYELSGTLAVNGSNVKVVYEGVEEPVTGITVSKATYGMNGVNLTGDLNPVYDGQPHALTLSGTLPNGVTAGDITYTKQNGTSSTTAPTDAGTYTVTASFTGDSTNYNAIPDKTATLTIKQAKIDGITFADEVKPEITGTSYTLEATGVPSWVTVSYSVEGQSGTVFGEAGEYKFTATFTHSDPNYEQLMPMTATLTVSAAVVESVFATVEDGAKFDINNTLDDVKAKIKAEISFNNGLKADVKDEDLHVSCSGVCNDGTLQVGTQIITVTYNDGTHDYTTTVEIVVTKVKVALPIYSGNLSYSGNELKPSANDFMGYDSALMSFVESKTVAGTNAGTYKAVFALTDTDRYEWATATTLKKALFAVVYEEVVLEDYEAAVDWNLAKAKISATKANGKLPVFASESFSGSLADIVGLKYYTDETCTEEISADELAYSTKYYVKAQLLNGENFEFDESAMAFSKTAFEYTTPEKQLTIWEKIVKFVTVNWLWLVIAVVALILFITIIALIARSAKKKREREERRIAEEKEEKKREQEERKLEREERMARMSQQQAMPQMMMPQMMPQMMGQMPQQMPQPAPQSAQPAATGGGSASDAQLAQIQSELAAMRAEQAAMRTEVAMRAEQAAIKAEQSVMHSEIYAMRGGEQAINGGISLDKLTEIIRTEVRNAMANEKAAAQATPAAPESAPPVTAQVPPDAVMTTVTTTKIDTTKKPAQNAQAAAPVRTVVRNVVAPMPVDDGRVFDVGGFYKPADPMTDIGFTDEDNKD